MKRLSAILIVMALFAASMPVQASSVNRYAYNGKFKNSKITVTIWFEENVDGVLSGEIVYTNTRQKTPIRILGRSQTLKDGVLYYGNHFPVTGGVKSFNLTEFQKDGLLTGRIDIVKNMDNGTLRATWYNNNTKDPNKPSSYDIILTPVPFPNGKGGTLTYSTNPVGKYGFHYYDYNWDGELCGRVEISYLKGNTAKKRVYIDNATHNIAEYEQNLTFNKGVFTGRVKPCDIEYRVHVFKDFVFVEYTEFGGSFCPEFGEGASIEGFYPRIK